MPEFQDRLQRVRRLISQHGAGAYLITRLNNFAWLTGGSRGFIGIFGEASAAQILVLPDRAVMLVNEIEAGRMADEEMAEATLDLVRFPWYDDAAAASALQALVGTAKLASDYPVAGATVVPIDRLRWTLAPGEVERARRLGRETAEALESVAREFPRGETEFQVTGRLAAALWSRGIEPVVILVGGDERACRYRHPIPTAQPINQYGLLVVCGRRHGLIISCSRMVCFGEPSQELRARHALAAQVDAAMIAATRPGRTAGEIFSINQEAYAAGGYAGEWTFHHQGGLAGYSPREYRGLPGGDQVVEANQLFAWNPTVQGAKSEDTILVGPDANEVLTYTGTWPEGPHRRPGILVR